jgi:predicted Zn finger-like uncharacterized protein
VCRRTILAIARAAPEAMLAIASRSALPHHRTHLHHTLSEQPPCMRIVCPSCSAAYDVPDSLVTAGRTVRCARCHGDWAPVAAVPVPVPEPEVELAAVEPAVPAPPAVPAIDNGAMLSAARPSAMDRLAAHPVGPPSRSRLRLAWAASLVVLILLVVGGYAWRDQIVAAWPPSARMYAAFGMHPDRSPTP